MAKTDLEIAQECVMEPIEKVAAKIGIPADSLEHYGKYKAKLSFDFLKSIENNPHGKLVLVTAINPTKAGEGKSTTTVGLGDALNRLGKKTMMALREPSLGPVFGLKGGATGGGYAQVVPMEDINLHFTGDMHAITTANNLVSACLDNTIHQGNELNIDPEKVTFKRCLDMNDRTLRNITIGCGAKANGVERKDGFNITVASEIMAALCLADDLMDLKERFGKMLVAYTYDDQPVYVHDLGIEGALAMVMKDAVLPNIVQTLEHNPVLIHGGPFANIAHGCNSVIATKACLELADYTVTEAGFGADLGAEKFLDIKCRLANLKPNAVVIVATIRALKQHGGIALEDLKEENVEAMLAGCENLAKHIDTVQQFGLPYIVAINEFATDTPAEVAALEKWCEDNNHPMSLSQVWAKGGEGAIDLANKVVALCDQENNYAPLYDLDKTIEEKVETIAKKVYGADGVDFTEEAQAQIAKFNELGWDKLPICMAKTQMSLSDDGKVMGRPTGFRITVRELRPSLGAGFIVALTGKVLTMPGLPKHPSALDMDVDEDGKIVGFPLGVDKFVQRARPPHDGPKIIAVSGGSRPVKGNDVVARAVGVLRSRNSNFELELQVYGHLYAKDPSFDEACSAVDAHLMGQVSHSDFEQAMSRTDIFIMNSRYEPFGLSALDALQAGTSVLLSKNCGVSEILNLEQCDVIENCEDAEEVASKAAYLIDHPNAERLYKSLDFSVIGWDVTAARIRDICEKVVSHE